MLTMLETLTFAAEVKLPPSLSRAEKLKRVWVLIEELGLQLQTELVLCWLAVKKCKAEKDPNRPKRPPSAFFVFM
ncbi:hypothetical protein ZWY2020_002722 [Hordeum vulgare]|nr:hypothetical protein ZWY2020_002722 [Hordeum vulgare]